MLLHLCLVERNADMCLSMEELDDVLEKIRLKVFKANRMGELEDLLVNWGIYEQKQVKFERFKCGKIVVIGSLDVSESVLLSVANSLGIRNNRFEFCDYNTAKKFNFRKLQGNLEYSVVLFGPTPHSTMYKGDSGSIIAELERNREYPPVKRVCNGNELRINKNTFKQALIDLLNESVICKDF